MKQKLRKIGNSTGLIIPKEFLENLSLKSGDIVSVEKDPTNHALIVSDKPQSKSSVTPEFVELLHEINDKYEEAWRELAKR